MEKSVLVFSEAVGGNFFSQRQHIECVAISAGYEIFKKFYFAFEIFSAFENFSLKWLPVTEFINATLPAASDSIYDVSVLSACDIIC